MIALSLMLLAGYGGMVSLAQMTIAGVAAYTVAIFGHNIARAWASAGHGGCGAACDALGRVRLRAAHRRDLGPHRRHLHDHDHARHRDCVLLFRAAELHAVQRPFRLCRNPAAGGRSASIGALRYLLLSLSVRRGAPAMSPCSIARARPSGWRCRRSATTGAACARSVSTSPRIRSLRISFRHHRRVAGVLLVWFNGRVSPGTIDVGQAIEVLVIAVIGGLRHPIGPFIGAVFVILIQTFAIDIVGAERFNTLIGLVFLAIVFSSPDGLLGLWGRIRPLLARSPCVPANGGSGASRTNTIHTREDRMSFTSTTAFGRRPGRGTGNPVPGHGGRHHQGRRSRHLRGRVHGAGRGQHAWRRHGGR